MKIKPIKVAIAADHAGFRLKEKLKAALVKSGCEVKDFGCYSEESVDYPDFAHPLAVAVEKGDFEKGITICGSGNGINMTANKHNGIRAALCWNETIARLAREHNDANVCSIPGRFVSESEALLITERFLSTLFEGGRHIKRVNKIPLKYI